MLHRLALIPLVATAVLAGCAADEDRSGEASELAEVQPPANYAAGAASSAAPLPPMVSPVGTSDGEPDLASPLLTPEARKGDTGARSVLLAWARAIELEEFDQAWAMMGETARRKTDRAEFVRRFADLGTITVAVPGGAMEGAAGSLYYTSQATITSTDSEGRPVRIEGPVVLRRANDVPGATEEQLRWKIVSADLDWTH